MAKSEQDVERGSTPTSITPSPTTTVVASPSSGSQKEPDKIFLEWEDGDPRHPLNWSLTKRYLMITVTFFYNSSTAMNATGYTTAQDAGSRDLGTSPLIWLTGATAYLVPVALTPLVLAPLSEIYGRRPVYLISLFIYTMMFIPQALAPNMAAIIASRIVQGCAGSVGNTMVAGSVADCYPKHQRAIPMSAFVFVVFMSQAIGSCASGWTVATIGWRWIFWWQGAIALVTFFAFVLIVKESRATIILSKRAKELTKQTGILHTTEDDQVRRNPILMASQNLGRPIVFFFTEPIVAFLALWIGFLWGVVFLSLDAVSETFKPYGWTSPQINTVLLSIGVGGLLGFLSNFHQARIYARHVAQSPDGKTVPEVRLYWAMPASVLTAGGLFWYGWTAQPSVHPAVPIIGLVIFSWGTYIIYLATLNYLADAYEHYASSGIACQALLRNIFGGTFGLFAHQMYRNLTPPYATTVLACIAAALGIAPFALFFWGPKLRSYSRIHRRIELEQQQQEQHQQGQKHH